MAGLLDQITFAGFFLLCFGLALLLDELDGEGRVFLVVGLFTAIFGLVALMFVESWWAKRRGTTVGLWVLGLRFDPRESADFADAFEGFFYFWPGTVLLPLTRLLGAAPENSGVVRDPRQGGRGTRGLLFILIITSPVLGVLALLS